MGIIHLGPVFCFALLLLPSCCRSQSPDATVLKPSIVTVYDCPAASNDVFSGDESPFIAGSPVVLNSTAPPAVLLPAVHSGVNQQDYNNFIPQQQVTLYYEQASYSSDNTTTTAASDGIQNAFANIGFNYPTIALEHCGFVSKVSCSGNEIAITLADLAGLNMAEQWPSGNFLLVGAGYNGCGMNGVTSGDSRFYALVSSFSVDTALLQIIGSVAFQTLQQVLSEFDLTFGGQGTSSSGSATPTTLQIVPSPTNAQAVPSGGLPSDPITSVAEQAEFDQSLDDALGYLDPNAANFLSLILPGVDVSNINSKRDLIFKRSFFSKLFKKIVAAVKSIKIPSIVKSIVKDAGEIVAKAVQAVVALIPPVNITPIDSMYPIRLSAANFGIRTVDTYFGSGTPIYKAGGLGVYCVDCGLTGSMHVVGKISASITHGVTTAMLTVNGPLHFGFNVALIADYEASKTFEKQLGSIALTPFQIPGLISFGPELTFGVGIDLGFKAQGGALAGVSVDWNNINVVIDLINKGGSKASGFAPNTIKKNLLLHGEIDLTGEAYVKFGIDFGIDVLDALFKIDGGVEDKPGLELDLKITDSISLKRDTDETDLIARDCQGVDVALGFKNELSADFKAGPISTEIGINTISVPITEYCYS